MRRLIFVVPIGALMALAVVFWFALRGAEDRSLPSALIDKPVPEVALPGLEGVAEGFGSGDLAIGRPILVNVFASWCVPCLAEHPVLTALAQEGIPIYAINYKNAAEDAKGFLDRHGNPYTRIGVDPNGRAAIEWGVYGVPETFVVDGQGRIRFRFVGPLTPELVETELRPILAAAAAGS